MLSSQVYKKSENLPDLKKFRTRWPKLTGVTSALQMEKYKIISIIIEIYH